MWHISVAVKVSNSAETRGVRYGNFNLKVATAVVEGFDLTWISVIFLVSAGNGSKIVIS